MHYIISILKTLIFIVFFLGNIKSPLNDYLLKIKDEGIIYSYDYYKDKAELKKELKIGQKFFLKCIGEIFNNRQKFFQKVTDPLVSIVIPVYNAQLKIKKAIRSIQNQNISNLEIILINDCSSDKTVDVIKDFIKYDERIILLENKENKGILYSRCIGTLKATGKFIFPLDNDDLFFDEGIINCIVNEAIEGKFDIVEFNYAEFRDLNIPPNKFITSEFGNHTHNLVLYQPELGQFPRYKNKTYGVYDCYIWAKCINSTVYKYSINKIGPKIYSKFILRGEDFILTFVLFRLAKSFKFFSKYGIFRYKNVETAQYKSSWEQYLLSRIIYLEIILRFTKNDYDDKKYIINFCNDFFNTLRIKINLLDKDNRIYFKKVFHRLLVDKYIEIEHKNNFIHFFKNLTWLLK